MTNSKPYLCSGIEKLEGILNHGEQRAKAVTDLLPSLNAAKKAESHAATGYAKSLAEPEAVAVEKSAEARQRIEARVNALVEAFECQPGVGSLPYISRMALEQITLSDESKELCIKAHIAKAAAVEKLVAPAKQGLLPRIGSLLTGGRSASESVEKASRYTAQGLFLEHVERLATHLRTHSGEISNGSLKLSRQMLSDLKAPLPHLSNFKDVQF